MPKFQGEDPVVDSHFITSTERLDETISRLKKKLDEGQELNSIGTISDKIEKLLRIVFVTEVLLSDLLKEDKLKQLLELIKHKSINSLDGFQIIMHLLDYLEHENSSGYKILFQRRELFEKIISNTCCSPQNIMKLGKTLMELGNKEMFSQFIGKIFSFSSKVTNFLETCPLCLRQDQFYLSLFRSAYQNSYDKVEFLIILLNKLLLNGSANHIAKFWESEIINSVEVKNQILNKILSEKWEKIHNFHKLIREIIVLISSQNLNSKTEGSLNALFGNVDGNSFLISILPRLLNDKFLNLKAAKILISLILSYSNRNSTIKLLEHSIESILLLWSDINFIRKASNLHLKFLTNLLRNLVLQATKESLSEPEFVEGIQKGITHRLSQNLSGKFHRQCGEAVWTAYIIKLEIPETLKLLETEKLYNEDMKEQPEDIATLTEDLKKEGQSSMVSSSAVKEEITNDDDSDEEFMKFNQPEENESIFELSKPKHLYDCLLGLRSNSKERLEYSLKYINYLIRHNLNDVEFMAEELSLTLCKINNYFEWDKFEEYRGRALISLCIIIPDIVSNCLIKRFYYSETSLGEKLLLLGVLERAARELAENPEKFRAEHFNEFEKQHFLFKPVTVKYMVFGALEKDEDIQAEKIEEVKKEKLENQSRRWGETKRKADGSHLKTISNKELLIINSDSQKIFINRFNSLANHFFFPLLMPLREKKRYMLKEPSLLGKVISLMKTYMHCAKNSPTFYTILEEVLDFLIAFLNSEDTAVLAELFTCFYVVSTILNKNVVLYYNNIVQKLLLLMKLLADLKERGEQFKILMYEISNNIQKLFEIEFSSSSLRLSQI